jgi:hypothetical protein
MAIAISAFSKPGPSAATSAMASSTYGNAINTSMMRISTVSTAPP